MKNLEIRNDDVLQLGGFTSSQRGALRGKSMFQWFLEVDKFFEKYNHKMILAICSEGILSNDPEYIEWVKHIKKNRDRYTIELHGFDHKNPKYMTEEDLLDSLAVAKLMIEETFNCDVTTWYVPFGRRGRHEKGDEVCEKLGIKMYIPDGKVDAHKWFNNKKMSHVNFHSWCGTQNRTIKKLLEELYRWH